MTRSAVRQHRHHKNHRIRRAIQAHGGGRHPDGAGLRLPEYHYEPPPGMPYVTYPSGWKFGRFTPGCATTLVSLGMLAFIVLCIALAKALAG